MIYSIPMKSSDCADTAAIHPRAADGLRLFNQGQYFEAHEALEDAWRDEPGPIRELYRGILQAAVVYLHIRRGNYSGSLKVFRRSQRWLNGWPEVCRGIQVGRLRTDLENAIHLVRKLTPTGIGKFDPSFFKPIEWVEYGQQTA